MKDLFEVSQNNVQSLVAEAVAEAKQLMRDERELKIALIMNQSRDCEVKLYDSYIAA